MAAKRGANIAILDDGLQNYNFKKDFSILVIDSVIGFGNGWLIPSGPLREPVKSGLGKSDVILTLGSENEQLKFIQSFPIIEQKNHFQGSIKSSHGIKTWKGIKVFAFSGIARPEKFFNTLSTSGALLAKTMTFPNHLHFNADRIKNFISQAVLEEAIVITTEKDFVKLPIALQKHVIVFKITLEILNQSLLLNLIQKSLDNKTS
jgi:tetraacyldisaccharide 4'-kinase